MARQGSGTGQGGKSFQDRELAATVRTQALNDILAVLTDSENVEGWSDYKKQVVLKLSGTVLPRLNEHTGEDGGPIQIKGVEITVRRK
jgi:hypothetical protein